MPVHIDSFVDLSRARRWVIKVGSALLADAGDLGHRRLAEQLSTLWGQGCQVALVSSGSVALGLQLLKESERPTELDQLQAAAALGQPLLMSRWRDALMPYGKLCAQLLLTQADFEARDRFLNARHALRALWRMGVVPVVNENDTVATDEIKVGDNDHLSAHVACLIDADVLVLLSSVAGVYVEGMDEPVSMITWRGESAEFTSAERGESPLLDDQFLALTPMPKSKSGVGGIATKISAARLAGRRGIAVVLTDGRKPDTLARLARGEPAGTLFLPQEKTKSRKHWIAYTLRPKGRLLIDDGAVRALRDGRKSLLASGIREVTGAFERGAMVEIDGPLGPVARGLVAYRKDEIQKILGQKSSEIAALLGYVAAPEVVHRDDLLLL